MVSISKTDLDFIVKQLSAATSRSNQGVRLGTHLIKRLRHSKKLLLNASERQHVAEVFDRVYKVDLLPLESKTWRGRLISLFRK